MPYTKQDDRNLFDDDIINNLIQSFRHNYGIENVGSANYLITRCILGMMKPDDGWTYTSLSRARSVLMESYTEIGRRLLGPYEDKAIERNGDLLEFQEVKK
jgi:hypothetical protein